MSLHCTCFVCLFYLCVKILSNLNTPKSLKKITYMSTVNPVSLIFECSSMPYHNLTIKMYHSVGRFSQYNLIFPANCLLKTICIKYQILFFILVCMISSTCIMIHYYTQTQKEITFFFSVPVIFLLLFHCKCPQCSFLFFFTSGTIMIYYLKLLNWMLY